MVQRSRLLDALGLVVFFIAGACRADTTVAVNPTSHHTVPTTLWGQTYEEVNSGDGGLYAELLQNRAFQKVTPNTQEALVGWHSINGANINVIADPIPVSPFLPNALQVTFPPNRFGLIGFGNEGFYGLKVDTALTYKASFYYRFPTATSYRGNAVIGFQTVSGLSLGSVTAPISGAQTTWTQVSVSVTPAQVAFNNNNYFNVVFDAGAVAGQTINFAMLSLFPPTYRNRANGVRLDIATAIAENRPGFFRFPGGKNLGTTIDTRWQWNTTVGALLDRPGRVGAWGYTNTDGLGLFEFLQFSEDIGASPIMGVWSGLALDGSSIEEKDLGPYIQQAIDQINFAIGPTSTVQGMLRATLGHSAPFPLTYIEIGNEDLLSSDTYVYRWRYFTTVLSQNFPQLRYIATSNANDPVVAPDPTHWDVHAYKTPSWFAKNSFFYDSFQRNGTLYLEGEYAVVDNDIQATHDRLLYPTLQGSLGEAAFMTGLERNSDIVFGAAYSPLLNNVANTQWTPNLLSFDVNNVYRSTSFYVQKLFATNRGQLYYSSTLPNPGGTLFWSVTQESSTWVMKIVNTADSPDNITFLLPVAVRQGTSTVMKGAATDSNTPANPNLVAPVISSLVLSVASKQLTYAVPSLSLTVIRIT
ncbi:putative alpha-L-arabinofuranosidase A [Hypsizygus marmoreus]|uniref:non-reducing end alpha-L-arabinofuranosidase n=1 Tax=Hypsizygus marmoreus TaxID=39966 RepID=A0A369JZB1_HYPMA|nr:putative alpha-L-arabinofuranosidase A [Hypsizygus marmoreus]